MPVNDGRRLESVVDGLPLHGGARRRKERTYPELVRPGQKAKLVVLAGEVAGRWSEETASFLGQVAKARARSEPPMLQKRVEQAWRLRMGVAVGMCSRTCFRLLSVEEEGPGRC